jgi:hypothetical protein
MVERQLSARDLDDCRKQADDWQQKRARPAAAPPG